MDQVPEDMHDILDEIWGNEGFRDFVQYATPEEALPISWSTEEIGKISWGGSTQTFCQELNNEVQRCIEALDRIYQTFLNEKEYIKTQFVRNLEAAIINELSFTLSTILGIRDQLNTQFQRLSNTYRCFIYAMTNLSLCYQRQHQLLANGVEINPLLVDIVEIQKQGNKILSFIFEIEPELKTACLTYEILRSNWDHEDITFPDFEQRTELNCLETYETECVEIERLIYSKFSLVITQQPEQVIQTGQTKKARSHPVMVRSFNFRGNDALASSVTVQIYLINESTAERISDGLQPDLDLAGSIQLAGKMEFEDEDEEGGAGITENRKRKKKTPKQNKCSVVTPFGKDIKADVATPKKSLFTGLKIKFQNSLKNLPYLDMEIPLKITNVLRDNMGKVKIGEKESSENVAGQKYCFLFVAELPTRKRNGTTGNVMTWTTSLPLIVTTHNSHSEKAWAAIVQDNAFPVPERKSFKAREMVDWKQFSELLENLFKKWVSNGRALEESHLESIKNKLRSHIIRGDDNSEGQIQWSEIVGEGNMDDETESFWSYFYRSALIVNCPHLKDAWTKKYIDGFISFEEARQKLLSIPIAERKPGTFIVRFSDTKPGSISLVFTTGDVTSWNVYRMDPIEFYKTKSLDQCCGPLLTQLNSQCEIFGQDCFKCVYPDIPKEKAFKNFYQHAKKKNKEANKGNDNDKNGKPWPYVKTLSVLGSTNEGHREVVLNNSALGERDFGVNNWLDTRNLEPLHNYNEDGEHSIWQIT